MQVAAYRVAVLVFAVRCTCGGAIALQMSQTAQVEEAEQGGARRQSTLRDLDSEAQRSHGHQAGRQQQRAAQRRSGAAAAASAAAAAAAEAAAEGASTNRGAGASAASVAASANASSSSTSSSSSFSTAASRLGEEGAGRDALEQLVFSSADALIASEFELGALRSAWAASFSLSTEEQPYALGAALVRTGAGALDGGGLAASSSSAASRATAAPPLALLLQDLALCVALLVLAVLYRLTQDEVERATGIRLAHVCCAVYLSLSVSIDLSIKNAAQAYGGSFPFEPACCVIVVEVCKLAVSAVLFGLSVRQAHASGEEVALPRPVDVAWLAVPAAIYATNNLIVFQAIKSCPLAQFGVIRETMLIWNALIWSAVFRQSLSAVRWLAIFGIFLGCTLNQVSAVLASGLSLGVSWALLLAFTNAAGGVTNEFAMKQRAAVDINLQNCILYLLCASFTLVALAAWKPAKVASPQAFFHGFVPECWQVIILQAVAGLAVSRILKYVEAVTKTIVAALRGPCVIFLGAIIFGTSLSAAAVLATLIVCVSCFIFLREGPLSSAKPSPACPSHSKQEPPEVKTTKS